MFYNFFCQNESWWLDTVAAWMQGNPMDWEGTPLTRTRPSYVPPLFFVFNIYFIDADNFPIDADKAIVCANFFVFVVRIPFI